MKGTKKCPHCGHWSPWNQEITDRCQNCHRLLDPAAYERQAAQEERKEEESKRFTLDFIRINPDDPYFLKFFKSIGLGFQLAFAGIVSFILWLIAVLAG
ncbi:hypothetical protein [Rufibacter tibetensis]|uniref:Uncharacterized protein n=1 Tax=Rufibacter tibetensis TaxID=512763 RepID=A0A0P0CV36_9BACT|nr:hypothetical protein [Rufibacter tibetensis]ALI98260.1 hypothetical protein DC20_03770 [Rufibacter tibetensis]